MDADQILVGCQYKVTAPATTNREWWTVVSKRQNKHGDWEIVCTNSTKASQRIFKPEYFKDMKQKKEILSEGIRLIGKIGDVEMWEERVDYLPYQERRGRKPKEMVA